MIRFAAAFAAALAAGVFLIAPTPRYKLVQLPGGIVYVTAEMLVESGTEVRGARSGTVLRMAPGFNGRAVIVARGEAIRLHDFTIEGNRESYDRRAELPPYDVPFADFTRANGVLALDVTGLTVQRVVIQNINGFALLIARARRVQVDRVQISNSGSRNAAGRNNTTGGILFEEGAADFRVTNSTLRHIRGNGIWTHSLYTSPRNGPGVIARNHIELVGRDAIQVGHAFDIQVLENAGREIGFPIEDVDMEGRGIPVAIDTAGNVERTSYSHNRFEEINGKCFDLDGFHHGDVRANACVNRQPPDAYRFGGYGLVINNTNPDMQSEAIRITDNLFDGPMFGGIFVIGAGHTVSRNRLLNVNIAHCNEEAARFGCYYAAGEPDMLRSGIYLGKGAERPAPAQNTLVADNEITGYGMASRCIGIAPGVARSANTIRNNRCRD